MRRRAPRVGLRAGDTTLDAQGVKFTYKWERRWASWSDFSWGSIIGATGDTDAICSLVASEDAGTYVYHVVVSWGGQAVTSDAVGFEVLDKLSFETDLSPRA